MRVHLFALSLVLVSLSGTADAITIRTAKVEKGAVQVKGAGAVPFGTITWEGRPVTEASKRGKFAFETSLLPSDCVGDVSDGTAARGVVIEACGPTCCASADGIVVRDSNGALVGKLLHVLGVEGTDPSVGNATRAVVLRSLAGEQVALSVTRDGIWNFSVDEPDVSGFFFAAAGCLGEPLIGAGPRGLVKDVQVSGPWAYIPKGDVVEQPTLSRLVLGVSEQLCLQLGGMFTTPNRCCLNEVDESGYPHAPFLTFDLTTLGLVPPFRIDSGL